LIARGQRSADLAEPVGEELLGGGFAHAGDGEVVLLAGEGLDPVFVDGADFIECDLNAVAGIFGAVEVEAASVEGELTGAATEMFFVTGGVDDGGKWNSGGNGGRRGRHRVRGLRERGSNVLRLRRSLLRERR